MKFYASLGNHDDPNEERLYKPFNVGGERYSTLQKGDVSFFVLDSNLHGSGAVGLAGRGPSQLKG